MASGDGVSSPSRTALPSRRPTWSLSSITLSNLVSPSSTPPTPTVPTPTSSSSGRELGIGIVPFSPLGRGFFSSGPKVAENLPEGDFRKSLPRFQGENLVKNKKLFNQVNELATRKGCTSSQLALAWVHHQGNDVSPIPGTTKVKNFNDNIGALSVKLTPGEFAELERIADGVQGGKYGRGVPTWQESETPPLSE